MATAKLYAASGELKKEIDLQADMFAAEVNQVCMYLAIKAILNNRRQGNSHSKNKSSISGGGQKPWKQKGTGRARQGSIRAPQWAHGAIAHGPVPRSYEQRTPKKMKAAALRYVLSDRTNAGRVAVADFGIGETPSTKAAVSVLNPLTSNNFTTVVLSRDNINEWLSVRNIPTVHVLFADQLNTYDVVTAQYVVFSKEGFDAFLAAKAEPAAKEA